MYGKFKEFLATELANIQAAGFPVAAKRDWKS